MELKDAEYVLREAYMARLSSIEFGGGLIPVYDAFVPMVAPNFYIVVNDMYSADDSLKCGFSGDTHVTLDIVSRFRPGEGSSKVVDSISDQVKRLLVPNTLDLTPDFKIMNTIPVISKKLTEDTNTSRVIRKILTFKHLIQQLN